MKPTAEMTEYNKTSDLKSGNTWKIHHHYTLFTDSICPVNSTQSIQEYKGLFMHGTCCNMSNFSNKNMALCAPRHCKTEDYMLDNSAQ